MSNQEILTSLSTNIEENNNSNLDKLEKTLDLINLQDNLNNDINNYKNYVIYNRERFLNVKIIFVL